MDSGWKWTEGMDAKWSRLDAGGMNERIDDKWKIMDGGWGMNERTDDKWMDNGRWMEDKRMNGW